MDSGQKTINLKWFWVRVFKARTRRKSRISPYFYWGDWKINTGFSLRLRGTRSVGIQVRIGRK